MPTPDQDAYSTLQIHPAEHDFGAVVRGVNFAEGPSDKVMDEVRRAWADHGVLSFPDQDLSLDDLEAATLRFGPFGVDPFIAPMPGRPNVLELRREPDEKATNFGAGWHSDWSFQPQPPAATLLHAKVVPRVGGATLSATSFQP
ncbi:MAG TPA: TauD/TfdA family dioxygenase [Phenylobacterium sp.]|nr:TauD/TfdA family dioxygenase [Phenylobacterium sp.]